MSKHFSETWKRHYGHGKCKVCGERNLDYLTWHHRVPEKKRARPTKLTGKVHAVKPWVGPYDRINWLRAKREIDKCDLLCIWCHRRVHDNHGKKRDLQIQRFTRSWNLWIKEREAAENVQVKTYSIWTKREALSILPRQRVREMYCQLFT